MNVLEISGMSDSRPAQPALRGVLRHDEPMARHTTWRVGGPARSYYEPADVDDLSVFLAGLPTREPIFWLGLGSNLLVRDGGLDCTVISTAGLLNGLQRQAEHEIRVEAGVACAKLARFSVRQGLSGAEFLAGIPGTMGGALAMNAGAFGGETWSVVRQVETLDRHGNRRLRDVDDYRIGYRSVQGPVGEWFIACHLHLRDGDGGAGQERIKQLLRRRGETQPIGTANGGSVFRNPPGNHAARLIEACGLKDHRIGGAQVSQKHANFIINTGHASAAEIEALLRHVAEQVAVRTGVHLHAEVKVVGTPLPGADAEVSH